MKLLLRRVLSLLASLTLIGGLVYTSTGLFHHHRPPTSATWWESGRWQCFPAKERCAGGWYVACRLASGARGCPGAEQ